MCLVGGEALKLGADKGSDSALSDVRNYIENRTSATHLIVHIRYQPRESLGRCQRPSSRPASAAHGGPEAEKECERPIRNS